MRVSKLRFRGLQKEEFADWPIAGAGAFESSRQEGQGGGVPRGGIRAGARPPKSRDFGANGAKNCCFNWAGVCLGRVHALGHGQRGYTWQADAARGCLKCLQQGGSCHQLGAQRKEALAGMCSNEKPCVRKMHALSRCTIRRASARGRRRGGCHTLATVATGPGRREGAGRGRRQTGCYSARRPCPHISSPHHA